MARGRHRTVPVRRPLAPPTAGVAVAATMLAGPLLLASAPAVTAAPEPPSLPSVAASDDAEVMESSALLARDEASASRGQTRSTSPTVAPEPAAPAPSDEALAVPAEPPPAEPPPAEPPAVVGDVWATKDVNVRSGPAAGTEQVGYLAALDRVGATGTRSGGWTQVVVDGRVGWVNSAYLSESEPEPEPEPAPAPEPAPEAEAEPTAAPVPSNASCSIDPGVESNLTGNARTVYRAVCAAHGGSVSSFGGYRPGDGGDHGSGRAVDIMVSGEAGWEIARFVQARAAELGVTYVIYEQQIWLTGSPAGAWEFMEDRGGATANHYDHVHVSVR